MNIFLQDFISKKFKESGKALDLGAGKFFDVACLKQLGWKCIGVDKIKKVNLEKPYLSKNEPFDLVFSNYVLHKIKNKKQFIRTAFNNLKKHGWLFIHTFDQSDKYSSSGINMKSIKNLLKERGFKNISAKIINFYDNDIGHKHWHKILEATGQKG